MPLGVIMLRNYIEQNLFLNDLEEDIKKRRGESNIRRTEKNIESKKNMKLKIDLSICKFII